MKSYIDFQYKGVLYSFSVLNSSDSCRLVLDDVFVIDVFKVHNHSYFFKAFFYVSKSIYSNCYYSTKSKLLCAIQKLLEEELHDV